MSIGVTDVYLRTRSSRRPGDTDIEPDPASQAGRSIRVIGYSATADMVITVIVLDDEGTTYGVNAWRAKRQRRTRVLGEHMSKLTDLIDAETQASEASRDEPSRGPKRRGAAGAV